MLFIERISVLARRALGSAGRLWLATTIVAVPTFAALAQPTTAPPVTSVVKPTPPYLTMSLPKGWDNSAWRRQKVTLVTNVLRAREPLTPQNQQALDEWYTKYEFRRLALAGNTDPAVVESDPDIEPPTVVRQQLLKKLKSAKNEKVYDYLTGRTLWFMENIVTRNYHPAVRYNAMLLIGDLNTNKAVTIGAVKTPDEPLPEALDFMLKQLADPQQIDAVRVAALIGIQRHAELARYRPSARPMSDATREQVQERMLELVTAKEPPTGRTLEGHHWMQRRAIEVLGQFGTAGRDGRVAAALDAILADDTAAVSVRCAAAMAQGKLADSRVTNPSVAAARLALVAVGACNEEQARLMAHQSEVEHRQQLAAADSHAADPRNAEPDADLAPASDDSAIVKATCRRLKYRLHCVRTGLVGPDGKGGIQARATAAPHKAMVAQVLSAIDALTGQLDENTLSVPGAYQIIDGASRTLAAAAAKVLPKKQPPPTAAPAGDELPGDALPGGGPPDDVP